MNTDKATFGSVLRQHRLDRGVSLGTLSFDVGYSKSYLSKVENDLSRPSRDLAKKCDAEFDTDIFTTLVDEEVREKRSARRGGPLAADAEPVPTDATRHKFAEFYRQNMGKLLGFVRANGVAPDGAAVIVQDVMLECYQRWLTIEKHEAWIHGAARNKIYEHWRRELRRRDELGVGSPQLAMEMVRQAQPSAEVEALSAASVTALVEQLPHRQRAILVKWLDGMSPAAIADELRISESGVRSQVRKARQTLQVAFGREAVQTNQEVGDRLGEGQAYENLAMTLLRAHRVAEAERSCERAVAVYRSAGLYMKAGKALLELGNALRNAGKYEDSTKIFHRAFETLVAAPSDVDADVPAPRSQGCYVHDGRRPHHDQVNIRELLAAFDCARLKDGDADTLKQVGSAFKRHGDTLRAHACPQAPDAYRCAEALFNRAGDSTGAAELQRHAASATGCNASPREGPEERRRLAAPLHAKRSLGFEIPPQGR